MARQDIDYDFEDFGMTADDLNAKYGNDGQHPIYVRVAYHAYANMPTRDVKLSYWDWVAREIKKDDDAIPSNVPEPAPEAFQNQLKEKSPDAELVVMNSVDEFAGHIANWHAKRLAQLRHFLEMPEGQAVTVNINGEKETVELTGLAYHGFRAGLLTAILQFDSLPFAVSVDDAIDSPVRDDADSTKH